MLNNSEIDNNSNIEYNSSLNNTPLSGEKSKNYLDKYIIEEEIGEGAYGRVYKVRNK